GSLPVPQEAGYVTNRVPAVDAQAAFTMIGGGRILRPLQSVPVFQSSRAAGGAPELSPPALSSLARPGDRRGSLQFVPVRLCNGPPPPSTAHGRGRWPRCSGRAAPAWALPYLPPARERPATRPRPPSHGAADPLSTIGAPRSRDNATR